MNYGSFLMGQTRDAAPMALLPYLARKLTNALIVGDNLSSSFPEC